MRFPWWPRRQRFRCPATRSDWGHARVRCQQPFRHEGLHRYEDNELEVEWADGNWGARYLKKGQASA